MTDRPTATLAAALSEAAQLRGNAPFILHGDEVTSLAPALEGVHA
jgi:hypothetical protein